MKSLHRFLIDDELGKQVGLRADQLARIHDTELCLQLQLGCITSHPCHVDTGIRSCCIRRLLVQGLSQQSTRCVLRTEGRLHHARSLA